jgi:hypothetical protein
MEAEGDRHGVLAGRGHRRAHGQRAAAHGDVERNAMLEGEGLEQLAMGAEVELATQRPAVGCRAHAPVRRAAEQAVDRQPVLVARDEPRIGAQAHRGAVDAVLVAREAVGPRVQQRDAHRRAAAGVAVHAGSAPEQLPAAVAQRGADHPGARDEGGVEVSRGRAQADRLVALDPGGLGELHGRPGPVRGAARYA